MATWDNLLLVVLDGWGVGDGKVGDAVLQARTPSMDALALGYPSTQVTASGLAVGLPEGQMGNSEVGHTNLGAGRIVLQDLVRIDAACADGTIAEIEALRAACHRARQRDGRLHLLGLTSDGGVHSRFAHALSLAAAARRAGVREVILHCFLDGRDVLPQSAAEFVRLAVLPSVATMPEVRLGTMIGRFFAMDRDARWERTDRCVELLLNGNGAVYLDPVVAIESRYAADVTDEFLEPTILGSPGNVTIDIERDVAVFFNFRPDRARQLAERLQDRGVDLTTMTQYRQDLPMPVLFPADEVRDSVAEVVGKAGLRHLHAAETEKYAHVTYFFAGGRELEFPGEHRILLPSRRDVATYDKAPAMAAGLLSEAVEHAWADDYAFGIVNFANADMVGHTGDLRATIHGVEVVDACVGRLQQVVQRKGGVIIVTADHGNAEHMLEPDGSPNTAHTTNPVPVIVTDKSVSLRPHGVLADVAPTILQLLGLEKPNAMTAESLIINGR